MATPSSLTSPSTTRDHRRVQRRDATISEALDHAVAIMSEQGVGALSISEIARRMGLRGPSLYKYFASLHAVYDALFARGLTAVDAEIAAASGETPPGLVRIEAGCKALVRWCVTNASLAQLLYWRVVPGFEPSPDTLALSERSMQQLRAELGAAVRRGELDARADSDQAARLVTVLISGLITQQMANEPGVSYEDGRFTTLTSPVLDMLTNYYAPGGTHDPAP